MMDILIPPVNIIVIRTYSVDVCVCVRVCVCVCMCVCARVCV